MVGISAVMLVVFCRRLGIYVTRRKAIMWKHGVIRKTRSRLRIETPSGDDRDRAIGSVHKNLGKFGRVVFELSKRIEKRTDTRTDALIAILRIADGKGSIVIVEVNAYESWRGSCVRPSCPSNHRHHHRPTTTEHTDHSSTGSHPRDTL